MIWAIRSCPTRGTNHHALDDARWNKVAWEFLHELRIHNANRL
jgi:hypothetical protein